MPRTAAAGPPDPASPPPDTPAADQSALTTAPDAPAAVEPSPGPDAPDPGGVFVNVAAHELQIPYPPAVVGPGRVVGLPYTPSHRDLKPATTADIEASRAAEEAEAADAAVSGQEQ